MGIRQWRCLILVFAPQREPVIYRDDRQLPVLAEINLTLTPAEIFDWVNINRRLT
ncbi:hypothetical protein IQ250_20305 [Pseudanabaenaceae cyanobacterium LEGE 13415]|nr:hypothetical protein [Pseudanabaenaceae cyanobacterium LEGE 13415]